MTSEDRIQGLLRANNLNMLRRRTLAHALTQLRKHFEESDYALQVIDKALSDASPR